MGWVAERVEALLGVPVVATTPVAGGDICTATRLRLSNGVSALAKTKSPAPEGFFATEAAALRWLAEAEGVAVPEVLGVDAECLVLSWVETGRPSEEAAERLGRDLATTHAAGAEQFGAFGDSAAADGSGRGDQPGDGFIGPLPLPNGTAPTWPEFYATRRVLPYLKLARDRSAISAEDAEAVEQVVGRLVDLAGPEEAPARIHGDLWSGNVLWGGDGAGWVIDPAAHGGHRETDLAMLALFGLPQLPRVLAAYQEQTPLAEGWQDRVPLHQLHPLLVHAALFGGGYGAHAGRTARSLL